MHYVYILLCNDQTLYKGSTADLKIRLKQHKNGNNKSTCKKLPIKLIYYQAFTDKTDALREEKFLKTGKGRERIKYLLKNTLKI